MRIITGDECGLLKEIIPEYSRGPQECRTESGIRRISPEEDQQTRALGLTSLTFLNTTDSDNSVSNNNPADFSFSALRTNGTVEIWKSSKSSKKDNVAADNAKSTAPIRNYNRTSTISGVFDSNLMEDDVVENPGKPIAIHALTATNKLVCCDSNGRIAITSSCDEPNPSVVESYDIFNKSSPKKATNPTRVTNKQSKLCVSAFALGQSGRAAVGGRDRETTLFDIETGKQVWKAKNLKPDLQTLLQELIWSTAIQFLNDDSIPSLVQNQPQQQTSAARDDLLLVGTGYKQVKVYDVRTQRRPILMAYDDKSIFLTHPITALCQADEYRIITGNTAGYVHAMDLRKMKEQVGRFVGPAGSVKQIVRHVSNDVPVIACVGFDRMLRTYDLRTCNPIDKIYLKQRLQCMLFCSDKSLSLNKGEPGNSDEKVDVVVDDDAHWKALAENGNIEEEDDVEDYVDSEEDSNSSDSTGGESDDSDSNNDSSTLEDSGSEEDSEEDEEIVTKPKRQRKQ